MDIQTKTEQFLCCNFKITQSFICGEELWSVTSKESYPLGIGFCNPKIFYNMGDAFEFVAYNTD